jgi:protein TonB
VIEELRATKVTKISFAKIENHTPEVTQPAAPLEVKLPEPPKPNPIPRKAARSVAKEPVVRSVQPPVTASAATPPQAVAVVASDVQGTQVGADYRKQVAAWLARHKRYPERARRRGITGEALVSVALDRGGSVIDSKLMRSTESDLLDSEVTQMVARANPFPAPPSNYGSGPRVEFLVPVSFVLR